MKPAILTKRVQWIVRLNELNLFKGINAVGMADSLTSHFNGWIWW